MNDEVIYHLKNSWEGKMFLATMPSCSDLSENDLIYTDPKPDLYKNECDKMWSIVEYILSKHPMQTLSTNERVNLLREKAAGASDQQLADRYNIDKDVVNLHVKMELKRLKSPELKQFYDAFWS